MNDINGSVLVVGAGIAGIRSALDLAESGYHVILIDKAPRMGGILSQLDYQFPSDHCGMCRMLPMVDRDSSSQYCLRKGLFHKNIEIMLSTELSDLQGEPGKFQVTLRRNPPLVDSQRCMGCGECSRVCPVEVPDEFNAGLTMRKAIYLPTPHNTPNLYTVDTASCTQCGECEKVCPTGAIHLGLDNRKFFRILVVDDELIVRDSIKEWLFDEGFTADVAGSGVEALEKLSEHHYDLMLLDVKMPGMDGVEVLKQAKEIKPELPVVMMTAYATVETAVEAMKFGTKDYLMKPFDPEKLMNQVMEIYLSGQPTAEKELTVGAVIFSGGFASFDPAKGTDTYGYGRVPGILTSTEFERLMSGVGPTQGKLLHPNDGREIRKIAWLQCTGSRNVKENADFCSSICCMFSIKEAMLAKKHAPDTVETTIFYMDMRTYGKNFQHYRDLAENAGVRFVRTRVHSIEPDKEGTLRVSYMDQNGSLQQEAFDLVVLATGQRPPEGTERLAEMTGIELNPWGFCRIDDLTGSHTSREGLFAGGSFSGARDICESVIQASSASLAASACIVSKAGGTSLKSEPEPEFRNVTREPPRIAVVLCTCGGALGEILDLQALTERLRSSGPVKEVLITDRICTQEGWTRLVKEIGDTHANRVLIGSCLPLTYGSQLKELGKAIGLHPSLTEMVDIRTPILPGQSKDRVQMTRDVSCLLEMGVAKLNEADPRPKSSNPIIQKAVVVGGGIAGMTAALSIADHGFKVSLIEKEPELGGNLRKLRRSLQGFSPQYLLENTAAKVNKHPGISVYTNAQVLHSVGRVGQFLTAIKKEDGTVETLEHGVTILATGGALAGTQSYSYGQSEAIMTQRELEEKLHSNALDPAGLNTVAMIQCVDSREGDRNYCSRICCGSALKNALYLKEKNPDINIYILYRDMMTYGFLETYFTQARLAGILFIQYDPNEKPVVTLEDGQVVLTARDPILNRNLELHPDILVLSTGIVPQGQDTMAKIFGVEVDGNGFFQEADSKWRPVDFIKDGIFMCGFAHSPRSAQESIAMAEAAAQRALRILRHDRLASGSVVAEVRHSLCSLCERCIAACPYGARWKDEIENVIAVNELACQGCGSCAAVCPNSASVLRGFQDRQMLAIVDAAIGDID